MGKSRIKSLTIIANAIIALNLLSTLSSAIWLLILNLLSTVVALLFIYNTTLSQLKVLDLEIAHGLQIRSREWVKEGKSSSVFFLHMVKKQSVDWNMVALRSGDGSVIFDQDGLCRLLRSFSPDLFSASPCNPAAQTDLLLSVSPQLRALSVGAFSFREVFCCPLEYASWQDP